MIEVIGKGREKIPQRMGLGGITEVVMGGHGKGEERSVKLQSWGIFVI